jgi:hypothetical protein
MKQLCADLRQFAIQVHQLGFSLRGGVGERECLDLSECMPALAWCVVLGTVDAAAPAGRPRRGCDGLANR